jgi:hypothetical protein
MAVTRFIVRSTMATHGRLFEHETRLITVCDTFTEILHEYNKEKEYEGTNKAYPANHYAWTRLYDKILVLRNLADRVLKEMEPEFNK